MQLRKLYLHWVDMEANNYLVGELREFIEPGKVIYEIEYYKDCVDYLSATFNYFDRISGCPYQKRLVFRYTNRYPWFILERTPNDRRPDLDELLKEANLKYYDRWLYLIWNHGVCNVDRYFVSEIKNDKDYRHQWLHDFSIRGCVSNSNNDNSNNPSNNSRPSIENSNFFN